MAIDIKLEIEQANAKAVNSVIESDPTWIDILPASEIIEGMGPRTILHSGPPIEYKNMVPLHQRGMVSGILFERWAKNEKEAIEMLGTGEISIESALDHNTVGAGTGIITPSIMMMVIKDRTSGKIAATFPAEGAFQGGLCGWGLYSKEIAANLEYMRTELLPPLRKLVHKLGGISIKPILAEGFQMGDENHTRQTVADLLLIKKVLPELIKMDLESNILKNVVNYITETPRFFHCFGQGASMSAMLAAKHTEYSTMMVACGGNGVEYGIKVAGLGDAWFTAPAPLMKGRYVSTKYTEADQLPWIGDSCIVECGGMGGMAAAASPIVCNLRGMNLAESIAQTQEMTTICIAKNPNFAVPNLDFDFLPIGVDIRKVIKHGIMPIVHGGMFNQSGGLIGAGSARIPLGCFEKALREFGKSYGK